MASTMQTDSGRLVEISETAKRSQILGASLQELYPYQEDAIDRVRDVLIDLQHYCDSQGIDWHEQLRCCALEYNREKKPE